MWALVVFVVLILVIMLVVLGSRGGKGWSWNCGKSKGRRRCCKPSENVPPVYGEFIRPFTFESQPQLPIVQPGGSLVFPVATVAPVGVSYVDDQDGTGLLVPGGVYLVSWTLNPSAGSSVNLLVNGQDPTTFTPPPIAYAQSVTTGVLDVQYLIVAPLDQDNLISLVNAGQALFTLDNIPNTLVGSTSIITKVRVQRIANLSSSSSATSS